MLKKTIKALVLGATLVSVTSLVGCASVSTAIEKRNLEVQSKMSDTIFLEPMSTDSKMVYLDFRSTADKNVNIKKISDNMKKSLKTKGYSIVKDPSKANIMIQGNVLSLDKVVGSDPFSALNAGFGGAVVGGAIGAASGHKGSYGSSSLTGALIGGAIGMASDALVKDVYYNGIADVQIKQRLMNGQTAKVTQNANSTSGMGSNTKQVITGTSNWVTYRTRVVSVANQVNLDYKDAKPKIEDQLIKTIGGIF